MHFQCIKPGTTCNASNQEPLALQCIVPGTTFNASSQEPLAMHQTRNHLPCNASCQEPLAMHQARNHFQCIKPGTTCNASSQEPLAMHQARHHLQCIELSCYVCCASSCPVKCAVLCYVCFAQLDLLHSIYLLWLLRHYLATDLRLAPPFPTPGAMHRDSRQFAIRLVASLHLTFMYLARCGTLPGYYPLQVCGGCS
jgi:hypothetical protein